MTVIKYSLSFQDNIIYMNIVVLDGFTLNPGDLSWKPLARLGNLDVYDRTDEHEFFNRASDADVLLINKVSLDKNRILALPKLKLICVTATGYNVVDINEARKSGILVANVPDYGTSAVAQHVFAMLFNLYNPVAMHQKEVSDGAWSSSKDWCFWKQPIDNFDDKTLGIIGYGKIGQALASRAKSFGMKIIINTSTASVNKIYENVSIRELCMRSDIISLHCPLTQDNEGMVNKEFLDLMKSDSVLVNTARGGLINEKDLADCLNSNGIRAALLDVLSQEPPPDHHPLIGLDNCYITPHQAWGSHQARQRLMDILIANVSSFLNGSPQNIVN